MLLYDPVTHLVVGSLFQKRICLVKKPDQDGLSLPDGMGREDSRIPRVIAQIG